nr:SLAP domain-containing protein [Lactobacillus amylovorus]
VLADSSDENAPQNQVKLDKDGKFSFTFTAENVGQRPVAYIYTDENGQKVRGTLNIILDTVVPTLNVDQVNGNELHVKTNNPVFKLAGVVNDNLDGYRLYVNGDNIYREFLNSGYNKLAGLNTDNEDVNPYGPHNFEESFNLNDDNNQPTTHVFTVYVVDQVGNKVEKKITVDYDPNYVAEVPKSDQDNNQTTVPGVVPNNNQSVVSVSDTTSTVLDKNGEKKNDLSDAVLTTKSFPLLHNAYLYDENGEVVLTSNPNKKSSLKKGQTISALQNGHVYVIKGVKFYQVGKNQYVKVANTVLQAGKRLQLKHNAFVYDAEGNVVKKHGKKVVLNKNKWISALNNADKFTVKGVQYYKLGDNQFVKVANTVVQPAKKLKLTRNAFVYDQNGKRVKNAKLLKKGTNILALNNAEKFRFNNKTYYQIGKNQYVKVANTL